MASIEILFKHLIYPTRYAKAVLKEQLTNFKKCKEYQHCVKSDVSWTVYVTNLQLQ